MSEPLYGFRQPLDVRLLPDGRWQLLAELRYLSAVTQKAYTIEAGTVTNFASVPRIPVAYWLTGNTAHLASFVHDYLYANAIEPRDVADSIFYEIMGADFGGGAYDDRSAEPRWRRGLMRLGVELFGKSHYVDANGKAKAGFQSTGG